MAPRIVLNGRIFYQLKKIKESGLHIEFVACLDKKWVGVLQRGGCTPEGWVYSRGVGVLQRGGCTPEGWVYSRGVGVLQRGECTPEGWQSDLHWSK